MSLCDLNSSSKYVSAEILCSCSKIKDKINLLPSEARRQSGNLQTGSGRQFTFAKIKCRKERGEILDLITLHLRGMCNDIKKSNLIAFEQVDDATHAEEEVETHNNKQNFLAFYATAMGREGCAAYRCPYCDLTSTQFSSPDSDSSIESNPLSYECPLQYSDRLEDPENKLDTGGLNRAPILQEEPDHYIIPLLHIMLSLVNKVHRKFTEFLDDKVEILNDNELLVRAQLNTAKELSADLDAQLKEGKTEKATISSEKKIVTNQIQKNKEKVSALKREKKAVVTSLRSIEIDAKAEDLQALNIGLCQRSSALLTDIRVKSSTIVEFKKRRKELKRDHTNLKGEDEKGRSCRKKRQGTLCDKIECILKKFQIERASYHEVILLACIVGGIWTMQLIYLRK